MESTVPDATSFSFAAVSSAAVGGAELRELGERAVHHPTGSQPFVPPSGVGRAPPPLVRAGPRITSRKRGGGLGAAACALGGRLRAKETLPSD